MRGELDSLRKNVLHMEGIIAMQQSYARVAGMTEAVKVADLVEDALRLNADTFDSDRVKVVREYEAAEAIVSTGEAA